MEERHEKFYPGQFYHIFNRGNNSEKIFFKEENYKYFLKKFDHYLSPYVFVYAYCLLPNHFHFLVKIKSREQIPSFGKMESAEINKIISQQFRSFFISYSMSINKQQNRTGSLFQKNFKRILINDQGYLTHVIYYIHHNPLHHKVCKRMDEYKWSSFAKILENKKSKLRKKDVIEIFGSVASYLDYHKSEDLFFEEYESYIIEQ